MTRTYIVAPAARADMVGILIVSNDKFGARGRDGYVLIAAAIDDIVGNRSPAGAYDRPDPASSLASPTQPRQRAQPRCDGSSDRVTSSSSGRSMGRCTSFACCTR